jgi:hypothetical protein
LLQEATFRSFLLLGSIETNQADKPVYVYFLCSECTQDIQKHDVSLEHIPNLICAQQMCSKGEAVDDLSVDCK